MDIYILLVESVSSLRSGICVQQTKEVVIQCLTDPLGEDASALIRDFKVSIIMSFMF